MKIVLVSDSHGKIEVLEEIRKKHPDAEAYIHCGDTELPPEYLTNYMAVQGNNDIYHDYPQLLVLTLESLKILIIHGHQFTMFRRKQGLVEKAHSLGCNVVCYGHTHIYDVEEIDHVHLLNPGSLHYNRDGTPPSYMIIYYEDGVLKTERQDLSDL